MLAPYNAASHNCYQPHLAEPAQHTTCSNTRLVLLKMAIMMPETCWESVDNKHLTVASCWFSLSLHNLLTMHGHRNLKLKNVCIHFFSNILTCKHNSLFHHHKHLPEYCRYSVDIVYAPFQTSITNFPAGVWDIYRVSQEECARLQEGVPYVKVYRYNPKHLCPKLNGYGDNGQRKVWSSCRSTHCTCQLTILSISVLECGVIWWQFSSR